MLQCKTVRRDAISSVKHHTTAEIISNSYRFFPRCVRLGLRGVPYVSEGLGKGFVFSRPAASAAVREANTARPNDYRDIR